MSYGAVTLKDIDACNRDIGRICGSYRIVSERWWDFRGGIATRKIGTLEVADVRFSDGVIIKDRKRDEFYMGDQYFLVFQAAGTAIMRQRGSEALLRPGDCTLVDSRYQSAFEVGENFHQYSFHMPAKYLNERLCGRDAPVAQRISGNGGAGGVLSDTLQSILRHGESLVGVDLTDLTIQLLCRAIGISDEDNGPKTIDRQVLDLKEISAYIDTQLHRADLSPKLIADYFNVSLRQLYRISELAGYTPAALIWRRRLEHARDLLKRSSCSVPITEIALRCGFKDGAHFSRSYRKTFGEAPKTTRSRVGLQKRQEPELVAAF